MRQYYYYLEVTHEETEALEGGRLPKVTQWVAELECYSPVLAPKASACAFHSGMNPFPHTLDVCKLRDGELRSSE